MSGPGTANLIMSGNSAFLNPNNNPLALQIYVYGPDNGSGAVTVSGNPTLYTTVYAPQSQIGFSGNVLIDGGLVGRTVNSSGNGFARDPRVGTIQASSLGTYYRTAWSQCSPSYSPSAPGAGC